MTAAQYGNWGGTEISLILRELKTLYYTFMSVRHMISQDLTALHQCTTAAYWEVSGFISGF